MVGKLGIVLLCAHLAYGDIHSFKAFYTGTTGMKAFPEFVSLYYLDNEVMGYFDSVTKRFESKQSWMAETLGQQYNEQERNIMMNWLGWFPPNLQILKDRFNQTERVHTFQLMYGCQWDDASQATDGFRQYGYDGEEFISLDLVNKRWIAPLRQSEITKQKWDAEKAHLEYLYNYFTKECINYLKKYVNYGSSTLGRKVAPEVSLIPKSSSGVACHATGFYPDAVMITWKKNGQEMDDDVDVGETLPNEDGTFQKRSVLTVSPEERKKAQYSCEVTHKSRAEPINKILIEAELNRNGNEDSGMGMIIGIIAVVVLVVGGVIAGIVVMVLKKKAENEYDKASSQETNSNNSNPIVRTETEKLNPDPSV